MFFFKLRVIFTVSGCMLILLKKLNPFLFGFSELSHKSWIKFLLLKFHFLYRFGETAYWNLGNFPSIFQTVVTFWKQANIFLPNPLEFFFVAIQLLFVLCELYFYGFSLVRDFFLEFLHVFLKLFLCSLQFIKLLLQVSCITKLFVGLLQPLVQFGYLVSDGDIFCEHERTLALYFFDLIW
jgi:hypothetical protein